MAGSFPTLSDGQRVKCGYAHSMVIRCEIQRFRSGAEQRFAKSGLLNSFKLSYSGIKWADVAALRDFFVTQKGAYDATWDATLLDPVTDTERSYANLAFDTDEFTFTERSPLKYDVTLPIVQTVSEAVTLSVGGAFPTIKANVRVQLPYTGGLKYSTDRNDLDSGKRISAYAWASPLRVLKLDYPVLTNAQLATLAAFYQAQGGPVNTFTFTDPDTAVVYSNCRFTTDAFEITRQYTHNRVTFGVEQTA